MRDSFLVVKFSGHRGRRFHRPVYGCEEQDGHVLSAVSIANEAAPYCHAKLRQVEVSGPGSGLVQSVGLLAHLTDEELLERARLELGRPPLKLVAGPDTARVESDG